VQKRHYLRVELAGESELPWRRGSAAVSPVLVAPDDVGPPPDAVLTHRRYVPLHMVEWAKEADWVMLEYGSVFGTVRYTRDSARWHARKLADLMVSLGLHERWELRWHTERREGGWVWSVEYLGRNGRGIT
jgi:hypothetical protein